MLLKLNWMGRDWQATGCRVCGENEGWSIYSSEGAFVVECMNCGQLRLLPTDVVNNKDLPPNATRFV